MRCGIRSSLLFCIGTRVGRQKLQIPKGKGALPTWRVRSSSDRRRKKMASRWSGAAGGEGENRLVSLPLSRIRVIMKSSPEVTNINPDAIFLTAKATELFVQFLATYSYKQSQGKENKTLTYTDLSRTVEKSETFQFLADIVPKKILASKYLKMLEKEKEGRKREEEKEKEEKKEEEESEDEEIS